MVRHACLTRADCNHPQIGPSRHCENTRWTRILVAFTFSCARSFCGAIMICTCMHGMVWAVCTFLHQQQRTVGRGSRERTMSASGSRSHGIASHSPVRETRCKECHFSCALTCTHAFYCPFNHSSFIHSFIQYFRPFVRPPPSSPSSPSFPHLLLCLPLSLSLAS